MNSNILAFEESPHAAGELWAGSDDGLVHVTRDGGKSWQNVTPPGLAEWASIQTIEISPLAPGRVFVAAHRYRLADFRPLLYRTDDYGKTWTLLTDGRNGIPAGTPTRVIREDPDRKGLLYAGTEWGVYVSFDDGRRWQPFQLNLPIVPITDLRVHEKDLVVSTQGRSFWIVDDLTPLHGIAARRRRPPRRRRCFRRAMPIGCAWPDPGSGSGLGGERARRRDHPLRPARGDRGRSAPGDPRRQGPQRGRFSSERETEPNPPEVFTMLGGYVRDTKLTKNAGLNRFVWDVRYAVVDVVPDAILWAYTGGPKAAPGTYQVRLTVDGQSQTQPLRVLKDPRASATSAEFDEQLELMLDIRADLDRIFGGVRTVRALREQARALAQRLEGGGSPGAPAVRKAAEALAVQLDGIENELMQTRNEADQDVENFPTKVDNQLAYVYGLVAETDGRPTAGQRERAADLETELDAVLARLQKILEEDVAAFNAAAEAAGAAPVIPPR